VRLRRIAAGRGDISKWFVSKWVKWREKIYQEPMKSMGKEEYPRHEKKADAFIYYFLNGLNYSSGTMH
jgi:hypothetical protein